jgi:hypothetical protein
MVREYVLCNAHNSNFTSKFATYFSPSYFATQDASVAPKVFPTRQVIWINGLESSSSPITKARGTQAIMPQSFCPLNTKEKLTLLAKGEEITIRKAIRASNFCVPRAHVHQENKNISIDQLMECQL